MKDEIRPLTNGEEMLVARVFGKADFNWCQIKIVRGHHPMAQGRTKTAAHAWQNRLYFPLEESDYAEDFSKVSPWKQVTFIHEISHCWQHICSIQYSMRSRTQKELIDAGYRNGLDADGRHHHLLARDTHSNLMLGEARYVPNSKTGQIPWMDGVSYHTKRLNGFFEKDTTAYACARDGTARKLTNNALVWINKNNADYNYLHHDLCEIDFSELNDEEQAALITDYFCLVMGYAPEVYCWVVSPAQRPLIEVYKDILPFPT